MVKRCYQQRSISNPLKHGMANLHVHWVNLFQTCLYYVYSLIVKVASGLVFDKCLVISHYTDTTIKHTIILHIMHSLYLYNLYLSITLLLTVAACSNISHFWRAHNSHFVISDGRVILLFLCSRLVSTVHSHLRRTDSTIKKHLMNSNIPSISVFPSVFRITQCTHRAWVSTWADTAMFLLIKKMSVGWNMIHVLMNYFNYKEEIINDRWECSVSDEVTAASLGDLTISIILAYFYSPACECICNLRGYIYSNVAESYSEFNEQCVWLPLKHDNRY